MALSTPLQNTDRALDMYSFDDFERGVLAIARHLLTSLSDPDTQAWRHAFAIAVERLGETQGLAAAHHMSKLLHSLGQSLPESIQFNDPLCPKAREHVTLDELSLLQMLHHMRRDNTPAARDAVDRLTGGRMDPHVIRSGLALAHRFPSGEGRDRAKAPTQPQLRIVS